MSRIDSNSLALWKRLPSSTSETEERTFFIIEDMTRIAPAIRGGAES